MPATLIDERRIFKPRQFPASHTVIEPKTRCEPIERYPLPVPPVTDDEEAKFVAKAAVWMAVLGATPLILFHIINFFYPNFLWIPITPN